MNGVEVIDETSVVSDPDSNWDWDVPGPTIAVEVGLAGAKVIVSELDAVNGGDGCIIEKVIPIVVDECGGKDVALVDVDDLKLVKPRELTIGEADEGRVADVSVSVVKGKGVWGIQAENKEGGVKVNKLVKVDWGCAGFDAEIASWVDVIDGEVIIPDGVAEEHRGRDCVPFADNDTPKGKSKWFTQWRTRKYTNRSTN